MALLLIPHADFNFICLQHTAFEVCTVDPWFFKASQTRDLNGHVDISHARPTCPRSPVPLPVSHASYTSLFSDQSLLKSSSSNFIACLVL